MKETALLEVNKLLQLHFVDGDPERCYVSRIDDIRDNKIYIAWPTDAGTQAPVREGELLLLSFTREDAVYELKVKVEKAQPEQPPILLVQVVGSIQRTQRRENVRVRVNLPVELVGVIHVEGQTAPVALLTKVASIDFSGGGFSCHQKDPIHLGTILESRFTLPGSPDVFKLAVKVVRCTPEIDFGGQLSHCLGLMFLDMHESIRSRIVRYVFGAQNAFIRR